LLLTSGAGELCAAAQDLIAQHRQQITTVYIMGGTSAVPAAVEQTIKSLL
jgi:hypothetical protein